MYRIPFPTYKYLSCGETLEGIKVAVTREGRDHSIRVGLSNYEDEGSVSCSHRDNLSILDIERRA